VSLAYLVDTDWVIDHFHGVEDVTRKLEELRPAGLAISVVSLAELYEGIHYSRDPARGRAARRLSRPAGLWCHAGNDLAAVSPIDAEVRIGREYDRIGERLTHPDEAGIGEAHRNVRVLLDETQDPVELVGEIEREDDGATTKKRAQGWPAPRPEEVERLGENGIAGLPGRGQVLGLGHRPLVVTVATAQQRDHEPGVNENVCGHTQLS
jgi:predicted nucleic acid-binding protein